MTNRSLYLALTFLILFTLIRSTADIYTDATLINSTRVYSSLIFGFGFLFFSLHFFFKCVVANLKRWIKISVQLLSVPIIGISIVTIFVLSTCTFEGRMLGPHQQEEKIRDTRVFVDFIGNHGPLSPVVMGVYQEIPLFESKLFWKTVVVCKNEINGADIRFRIIDDYNIECIHESGSRIDVKLPY